METIKITHLVPGGQALATLPSGKKAFIWGALPGEIIEAQITKQKSSYCEGIATKIIESTGRRSNPRDLCYLATSPWQIMDYDYELEQKSALVTECFRQHHITLPPLEPAITDGQDYHYRNKMEYSLYWDNQKNCIKLAFHLRGTHRKIPIESSSIERPEILTAALVAIQDLNAAHQSARDYQSILIRCDQQGTTRTALFKKRQPHPQMPPLTDRLLDHQYSYSPNGFFQINLPVYQLALQAIQPHIQTAKVLDLYAGVGTIGLSVARDRDLTLVEIDKSAYRELVKNSPSTARPILAKSEEVLEHITPDTTVILDPPRAGCSPLLIDRLAQVQPPTIIYLSCNPITQARDIAALTDHYQITIVQPFNFFPRTPHIENLVVLNQK